MLSFDNCQGSQITVGLPELLRRRMTGTFFVMTVVLDKPHWMSRADFPHLAAAGYHTADQLGGQPLDRTHPLYTLRRTLVDSRWTGAELVRALQ